jgi:hypothetical protein
MAMGPGPGAGRKRKPRNANKSQIRIRFAPYVRTYYFKLNSIPVLPPCALCTVGSTPGWRLDWHIPSRSRHTQIHLANRAKLSYRMVASPHTRALSRRKSGEPTAARSRRSRAPTQRRWHPCPNGGHPCGDPRLAWRPRVHRRASAAARRERRSASSRCYC